MNQPSPPPDYLEIRGLTVTFDGFVAVDHVDLTVFAKDLRFLIGPNGAGKTTIIDALTGLVPATGYARYADKDLLGKKPHQIARLGVGRTFQTASVFTELTVLQNLDIAAGAGRSPLSLLRARRGVPESVAAALETIGLTKEAGRLAGALSHGQKQWLEIGMLLVQNAKVMLLDEPVAGMSADERDQTGALHRIWLHPGDRIVTLVGLPSEVLLYCFGRTGAARVEILGEPEAVEAFRTTELSV